MDEKTKKLMADLTAVQVNGGLTPLVTYVTLVGLIRLLKDKNLITASELRDTIELFLSTSAPDAIRTAAETAMLLCDDALLQAMFFPAAGTTPAPGKS